jgi:hypothetical protein
MKHTKNSGKKMGIRTYVVIFFTTISILGGWVAAAHRFENELQNRFVPLITAGDFIIKAKAEDIIIEKYKFKVTFKNIEIIPNHKNIQAYSDSLTVGYNIVNHTLSAHFNEHDVKIFFGKNTLVLSSPNQTIKFSKSLLYKNYDDVNIELSADNLTLTDLQRDSKIHFSHELLIKLANKLDDNGFYVADLNIDGKQVFNYKRISHYLQDIIEDSGDIQKLLTQESEENQENRYLDQLKQIEDYRNKIASIAGPADISTAATVKLKKDYMEDIVSVINGQKDSNEIFGKFSLQNDRYLFAFRNLSVHENWHDSCSFRFSNNGRSINTTGDMLLTDFFKEQERKQVIDLITNISTIFGNFDDNARSYIKQLVSQIMGINKMNLSFSGSYNLEDQDIVTKLKAQIDNFRLALNGESKNKIYEGSLSIYSPNILISGIKALIPVQSGLSSDQDNFYEELANNIKNNGPDFLEAFNKNSDLKVDNTLLTPVHIDMNNILKLKINDKNIFDLMLDERVGKFFEGLSKIQNNNQAGKD